MAAYVLQQNQPAPITPGDGALVGLLAGLVGAFVYLVLSIPINLIWRRWSAPMIERVIDMAGTMPPELRDVLERYEQAARPPPGS